MNKRQKEVIQASLNDEQHTIKLLEAVYKQASKDCAKRIADLNARTDMQNIQSIVYQKQYQQALKKQLDGIINDLHTQSFTTVSDYLSKCYENGHYGTLYDMQGQGVPLLFGINQNEVVKALNNDYSRIAKTQRGKDIYKRMGENTDHLRKSVRAELSRGIANGSSWLDMAAKISSGMNSPFDAAMGRAFLIARTEGHRVQNQATRDTQNRAKSLGADVVKQWDATLDGATRPWHADADGQIRELDKPFNVGGEDMDAPGVGGSARNVCNCRCKCLQRARWALTGEQTRWLGDVDGMTDEQKQKIAEKLGLSVDDLPGLSKSIVQIRSKDFKDFVEQAKRAELEHPVLTVEDFPKAFYAKNSDRKQLEKFIDLMNKSNGDPDAINLYKSLGKIDKLSTSSGIEFSISRAKNHQIKSSYSLLDNKYKKVQVVIPKLDGDDPTGEFCTTLHELGHYIDFNMSHGDPTDAGSTWFSSGSEDIKKGFDLSVGTHIGDNVQKIFDDFGKERKKIKKEVDAQLQADLKAVNDKYIPDGSGDYMKLPYSDFKKWNKDRKKCYTKANDTYDSRSRSAMGGGVPGLMDIYDALSGGELQKAGFYGHGRSYYDVRSKQYEETFANYLQLKVNNPDLIEELRKDKPKLCEGYDKAISGLAKKVTGNG